MNKDMLPLAVAGITVGLLVVVLAAARTGKPPTAGVLRRGGMAALLVYPVIAVPVFVHSGMTVLGLVLLVMVMTLPLLAMMVADRRGGRPRGQAEAIVGAVAGTGLAAAVLIAAGQTVSLIGRVDPRAVVVIVAVVAGLLVAGQGLAASSRISSVAMWLTIVFVVVSLALGFLLGGVGEVFSPIVVTDGPASLHVVAVAVALFVLGWADHGLRTLHAVGDWPLWRVFAGTGVVVVLILLGQLMFLGGSVIAPSLQFFVVPANLDILPLLAAVVLALLTVVFAALVAAVLAGVGALGAPGGGLAVSPGWVAASAALAALVALIDPGSEQVVVAGSLVAAALVGAQLGMGDRTRGVFVGAFTALAAGVVLALTATFQLSGGFVVAVVVVVAVAALATGVTEPGDARGRRSHQASPSGSDSLY